MAYTLFWLYGLGFIGTVTVSLCWIKLLAEQVASKDYLRPFWTDRLMMLRIAILLESLGLIVGFFGRLTDYVFFLLLAPSILVLAQGFFCVVAWLGGRRWVWVTSLIASGIWTAGCVALLWG